MSAFVLISTAALALTLPSSLWGGQLSTLFAGRLRGQALARCSAAMPATASLRTLEASLEALDGAGFGASDALALARRRPSTLALLATRSPAPLLAVLARLNLTDPAALCRARPALLALDAPRVVAAAQFLQTYVGRERLAEFVASHPESLLWRDDGAAPVAEHLRALRIPEKASAPTQILANSRLDPGPAEHLATQLCVELCGPDPCPHVAGRPPPHPPPPQPCV